jgi:hypothetical protein
MGNVALFILFGLLLFSILGLQQFTGITHYRCRLTEKPLNATYWPKSEIHSRVCSYFNDGAYECPTGLYCGSPLQYGISLYDDGFYEDRLTDYGINAFDNFGQSILSVMQILIGVNWSTIMYNVSVKFVIISLLFRSQMATLTSFQRFTLF